tara:strand:- start:2542 stop:2706 length:165 start_codon:yes stop_codon:yes gene_type:complete
MVIVPGEINPWMYSRYPAVLDRLVTSTESALVVGPDTEVTFAIVTLDDEKSSVL